jgi:transcriptional regulator with XRE-family HTH domain
LRAARRLEWIAERLGVERETISAIERGKTKRPGDDILDGLERHLGLTRQRAYDLMGGIHGRDDTEDDELKQTIIKIGTLKDPAARLAAVRGLPPEVRDAILLIASDYLLGAGQQLLAAHEQVETQQR